MVIECHPEPQRDRWTRSFAAAQDDKKSGGSPSQWCCIPTVWASSTNVLESMRLRMLGSNRRLKLDRVVEAD